MNDIVERLPRGARVTIIRLRSLGDCVLTTPAIHLLKSHRPDLHITVLVDDRFRAVFERNPDVDCLASGPVTADLCLNLHGGTRSALLTAASFARFRAGFAHFRLPAIYNVRIPRAQEILGEERTVHTAEHLASAVFYLGVPIREIPTARLFAEPERRRPYVVLHPFASRPDKAWPHERFVQLASILAEDLDPVFLSGPGDDPSPFRDFEVIDKAPLGRVMDTIAGASLFIGNDSGPAHLAAGFGLPVVVLFGPSNPGIWAPWKTAAQVLQDPLGMKAISVGTVLNAANRLKVKS